MYLDIHAHFAEEGYDIPAELARIRAAGVERVALASDTVAHSRMHATVSEMTEGVYFTAGVHPSNTQDYSERTVSELKTLLSHPKCIAVGEIGLDYHYDDTDRVKQREAFISQLLLAKERSLPVQIHSRDCAADTLAVLREYRDCLGQGFLLHCYSHGAEMMEDFLSLGAYFSFGGVVCFKNGRRVVESVKRCPLDRLLSETDSPYLSPVRGEKNSPVNIPVIVQKMAEVRGEDEGQLKVAIAQNARRLFPKFL